MQQSMQISLLCSTEHKEENMIFVNSPFKILDEAFRGLYPDKKYKACIEPRFGQKTGCRRKAKMCSCGLSISGSGTIRDYSRR